MIQQIVSALMAAHGAKWLMQRYNVSRQSVWKWKAGKSDPKASTLVELLVDHQDLIETQRKQKMESLKCGKLQ